ncbi:hypothetical protein FRC17_008756 [Serendipita sp. 399]|nr:hypothetical protein FRC17_008756 [Serendipita sp. 399]
MDLLPSPTYSTRCTDDLLHSLGPLPALERLHLSQTGYIVQQPHPQHLTPNLKTVAGLAIAQRSCKAFEHLPLTRVSLHTDPNADSENRDVPLEWKGLIHWEINCYSGQILRLLSLYTGQSLKSLDLDRIRAQDVGLMLSQLRTHSGLRTLGLTIDFAASGYSSMDDIYPLRIQTAKIRMYNLDGEARADDKHQIFRMLMHSMSLLETLKLHCDSFPASALSLLQSLECLQQLSIVGEIERDNNGDLCKLPRLRTLFRSSKVLDPLFYTPNLHECTIQSILASNSDQRSTLSDILPLSSSQSLVSLTIQHHMATLDLRNLPVLEEISMGFGTRPDEAYYPMWPSEVLEQLIMVPATCSRLRKVEFITPYQEWDMLLLMLERRNFLRNPNVCPIQEIKFRFARPTGKLLLPISSLLAGKFVDRLPIEEYSVTAVSQSFADVSKPDCPICVLIFKECPIYDPSETYFWPGEMVIPSDEPSIVSGMEADPPLPADVSSWLAGKTSRRETAIRMSNDARKRGKRIRVCSFHGSITVTAFTYGDMYV